MCQALYVLGLTFEIINHNPYYKTSIGRLLVYEDSLLIQIIISLMLAFEILTISLYVWKIIVTVLRLKN
jgi:hypothetical protein